MIKTLRSSQRRLTSEELVLIGIWRAVKRQATRWRRRILHLLRNQAQLCAVGQLKENVEDLSEIINNTEFHELILIACQKINDLLTSFITKLQGINREPASQVRRNHLVTRTAEAMVQIWVQIRIREKQWMNGYLMDKVHILKFCWEKAELYKYD